PTVNLEHVRTARSVYSTVEFDTATDQATSRNADRHWSNRLRQVDHSVCGTEPGCGPRTQYHHARGSRRIPIGWSESGSSSHTNRSDLLWMSTNDPSPGP